MRRTNAITARLVRRGTHLTRVDCRLTLRGGGRVSPRMQRFLDGLVRRRGGVVLAAEWLLTVCRPRLLRSGRQRGLTLELCIYGDDAPPAPDGSEPKGEALCPS